ncbi:MAG TPA: M24 family metallopeptidase, partial [Acidimicrobiales bacterium]|nr:M24 family metallopeptidase [Acidimicrobiales bacterium]
AEDAEEVCLLTGIESVKPLEALALDLQRFVLKRLARRCYTPFSPAEGARAMRDQLRRAAAVAASDPWANTVTAEARFVRLLAERHPELAAADLSPLLDEMRLVKRDRELDLLRAAGRLSGLAALEAMRCSQPGITEFELAAVADLVFTSGGARGEGYRAIIAAGGNAWHGHYGRLASTLAEGELVLFDYAPDVAYYTSDIGRMWPVDGHYRPLQRLLYGFVVDFHRALLTRIAPGARPATILSEAAGEMRERIEHLDFPDAVYRAGALEALEFTGHLSHPVGMSVHDVGDYSDAPLRPGIVFALDPMMWVPEHRLYIRCEDTVLVTAEGVEVLTATAPLGIEEIEEAMLVQSALLPLLAARSWWSAR